MSRKHHRPARSRAKLKKAKPASFRLIDQACDKDFLRQIYEAAESLEKEIGKGKWPGFSEYLGQIGVLHATRSSVLSMPEHRSREWYLCKKDVEHKKHAYYFGSAIGSKLDRSILDRHAGLSMFWVNVNSCVRTNLIDIRCRTVFTKSTTKGIRYYSSVKVPIHRVPMTMLFSQHARKRIVQRCRSYIANVYTVLDVAGSIMAAEYQEDHGIRYRDIILKDDYALELFIKAGAELPNRPGSSFWKLFYIPCYIEKNVAHVPTILLPGMFQTPEYNAVKRLPKRMRKEVTNQLGEGLDLSLLIWLWFQGEEIVIDTQMQPIKPPNCKTGSPEGLLEEMRAWVLVKKPSKRGIVSDCINMFSTK